MSAHDDMIIDVDSIDFSLIDTDGSSEESEVSTDGLFEADFLGAEEAEEEGEEFEDEEEAEEYEAEDEPEELTKVAEKFAMISDDTVLNIGDGVTMTKADLVQSAKKRAEVEGHTAMLNHFVTKFEDERRNVEAIIHTSLSETDLIRKSIEKQLANPTTTAAEKGLLYDELMQVKKREEVLGKKQQEYNEVFTRREAEANMLRLANINKTMLTKYPDWGDKAAKVGAYIGSMGVDNSAFLKAANPALIETIIKAMKFDETYKEKESSVLAKAGGKKPKAIKSRSSSSSKSKPLSKADKAGRLKALAGQMSPSEMFAFLED